MVVVKHTGGKTVLLNMPILPTVEDDTLVPTAAIRTLFRNLLLCPMPNLFTVGINTLALKAVARCFQPNPRHLGMLKLPTSSTGFPVRRAAGKHLLEIRGRNSMHVLCTTMPESLVLMVVVKHTGGKTVLLNMPNPPTMEDGTLVPTAAVRTLFRNLLLCPMPNLFTVGINPLALKAVARYFQPKTRQLGMLELLISSTGFSVRRAAGKHLLEMTWRNSMRVLCTTKPESLVQMAVA
jgi:hypothetical protein